MELRAAPAYFLAAVAFILGGSTFLLFKIWQQALRSFGTFYINGSLRWAFYIFYPLHLAALLLVRIPMAAAGYLFF